MHVRSGGHAGETDQRDRLTANDAVADAHERRRLYDQHSAINPGFKDYERKTTRVIPTILLERLPGQPG